MSPWFNGTQSGMQIPQSVGKINTFYIYHVKQLMTDATKKHQHEREDLHNYPFKFTLNSLQIKK